MAAPPVRWASRPLGVSSSACRGSVSQVRQSNRTARGWLATPGGTLGRVRSDRSGTAPTAPSLRRPRSFWAFLPILLLPTVVLGWVFVGLGMWWLIVVYALLATAAGINRARARQIPDGASGRSVATVEVTKDVVIVHVLFPGPLRHRTDVVIPVGAITAIRADPEASVHPPGVSRSLSGVANRRYSVGMFIPTSGRIWRAVYAVRRGMPSVVIDLHSDNFQQVVFDASEPEPVVAALNAAVTRWADDPSRREELPRARMMRPRRPRRQP